MISMMHYMVFSTLIFGLGVVGMMVHRNHLIMLLICLELMLLAVNTNFIAFSQWVGSISGQVFVFFVLTVAAAEAAIGLAIVVLYYRQHGNIDVLQMNQLKG